MIKRNTKLQASVLLTLGLMVLLSRKVFVKKPTILSVAMMFTKRNATIPALKDDRCLNKAKLSDEWNNVKLNIQDKEKFHLITNYVLYTHKAYYSNLLYGSKRSPTKSELIGTTK